MKPNRLIHNHNQANNQGNPHNNKAPSTFTPRTLFTCNNCGKTRHSVARCYTLGGGLEGQAPWMKNKEPTHHFPHRYHPPSTTRLSDTPLIRPAEDTARLAEQRSDTIIMMAGFDKQSVLHTTECIYPVIMTAEKSPSNVNSCLWLINSAASSHISGNKELFHSMHSIPPIKIDIANGESFTAN